VLLLGSMSIQTTSTRDHILQKGMALMSQAGLSGVTLGVLADQAGISKSGLFAHFRSKEDVQIELLTHTAEFAAQHVVQPAMMAGEGLPRLQAVVGNWFGWAQRAGLPGGCPVAAGLFEFDDIEGRVRNKILELEGTWRRFLIGLVWRAVELEHLRHDLDVDQFVWELCGIYLGHHAAHRFLRAADADSRAQTAFQALLARAMPPSREAGAHGRARSNRSRNKNTATSDVAARDDKAAITRKRRR
jgi:AcrR family transcriptional regulator